MNALVFIGDELNGTAFALAGVQVLNPEPAELARTFDRALQRAALVMLSRASADALAPGVLSRAQALESPLLVVVPDIAEPGADTGVARRIRGVLGIQT
jgi:vacuolar-type H+-ATPase subunit F/Vma7